LKVEEPSFLSLMAHGWLSMKQMHRRVPSLVKLNWYPSIS
jgi:hypothetical protein